MIQKFPTKGTSLFLMYFIHCILTNVFQPLLWPSSVMLLPVLTHIYITYLNLPEVIVICNCYEVMATQLTTFVLLYSCNNITLKMTVIAAETCW